MPVTPPVVVASGVGSSTLTFTDAVPAGGQLLLYFVAQESLGGLTCVDTQGNDYVHEATGFHSVPGFPGETVTLIHWHCRVTEPLGAGDTVTMGKATGGIVLRTAGIRMPGPSSPWHYGSGSGSGSGSSFSTLQFGGEVVPAQEARDFYVGVSVTRQVGGTGGAGIMPAFTAPPAWTDYPATEGIHPTPGKRDGIYVASYPAAAIADYRFNGTLGAARLWFAILFGYHTDATRGRPKPASLHTAKGEYVVAYPENDGLRVKRAPFSTPPFETSALIANASAPALAQDPCTERLYLLYEDDSGGISQQHSDNDGETWTGEVQVFANGTTPDIEISNDRFALRAAFVETDGVTGRGVIAAVAQEPGDPTWGDEYHFADAGAVETDLEFEPEGFSLSFSGDGPGRLLLLAKPAGETEYKNFQSWDDGFAFTQID